MARRQKVKHRKSQPPSNQKASKTLLIAGVFLVLLAGLMYLAGRQETGAVEADDGQPMAVGLPAPAFQLDMLGGQQTSLDEFRGNVVVVNFWATWCPPCRAEMPGFQSVYEEYRDRGLTVLAVNAKEPIQTVSAFVQSNQFTFPILLDQRGAVMDRYEAYGLPTSIVIDRDGIVQHIQSGPVTEEQLEQLIAPHL